jgi:hypothetical protein
LGCSAAHSPNTALRNSRWLQFSWNAVADVTSEMQNAMFFLLHDLKPEISVNIQK